MAVKERKRLGLPAFQMICAVGGNPSHLRTKQHAKVLSYFSLQSLLEVFVFCFVFCPSLCVLVKIDKHLCVTK